MAELERSKSIILTIPLEDAAQKIRYEQLELKAPTLTQVEKFYEKQESSTSIAAMRLLIALVQTPEKAYWHRWTMWIFANVRSICSVF
ncbi:Uncharacterised protein [Raoultella terrigena]|uniref:Uncharacterized protein n=1 Tax=Raoultella terrigena TaxID=577 RepID=A0A4U9DBG1_RAOTE|nr:Uncharacterised protein [Raoultella terrigena]